MKFTSHSVVLSNGEKVGANEMPLADSNMWSSIRKTIHLFLPPEKYDYSQMRVADLGCLEGAYSVEFARMGFNTLGIEARQESVDKANFLKADLKLDNLTFVKDDVRNLANYSEFDIVLCYGLLYHLENPAAFLKTINHCTKKLLLLHTHFAPEGDFRYRMPVINKFLIGPLQKRIKPLHTSKNFYLSNMTTNEGYKGRWFIEWKKSEKKNRIEKMLWASYNNDRSFWPTKKELTREMNDAGFSDVFERFDFTGDLLPDNYIEDASRSMFVGVKY